ncbi:hypothetical protein COU57_02635 [Candidatus Pacearchaeota archaeon CG10_big_fil_rev_8_21_14_0_10_32_14]|nr:MAG: hypothetical protein COU57_02635 [Candidatus Pacearchaeota archaeon CG10_big_fil_rev_8_21_14_0_10_32_14]
MEDREKIYPISLKNLVDETNSILGLYPDKKVVILCEEGDSRQAQLTDELDKLFRDYNVSYDSVPKEYNRTYVIQLRKIKF